MANLSMYGRNPLKSVSEYSREMAGTDFIDSQTAQNRLAMQGTRMKNDASTSALAEQNAMAQALQSGQVDITTAEGRNKLSFAFPTAGPAYLESVGKSDKEFAQAGQATSVAQKNAIETRAKKFAYVADLIGRAPDAQTGLGIAMNAYKDPDLGPMMTADFGPMMEIMPHLQQAASTPEGWAQVQGPMAMGLKDYSEQQLKVVQQKEQVRQFGVSDSRVRAEGAANRAVTMRGQNLTDERTRELADLKRQELKDARDAKTSDKTNAAEKRNVVLANQAEDLLKTVKEAKDLTSWYTAGFGGMLSNLPETEARKLKGKITTIQANLSFDRLQQMRDMSPTGGALGQVAVQELDMLKSTIASLDQAQAPADVIEALDKVERHYTRWKETLGGSTGGATGSFDTPAPSKGPRKFNPATGKIE